MSNDKTGSDVTSTVAAGIETQAADGGSVGDFVTLLKPRVMALVVFTAITGLVAAPGTLHPVLAVIAILSIAVGAGASGALNMWWDADIDERMSRTKGRPIPRGLVSAEEALAFGVVLSGSSVLVLGLLVNWMAGALLALTILYYVVIYTMWLKRRTPQNIVIGGAAGAFPPMIGWAAVTGTVSLDSIILFLIIFMWTPPHFWALALLKSADYARVGVPMLPVVAGPAETRRQILVYSVLLMPIVAAPVLTGLGGPVYAVAMAVLSGVFLWLAVDVWRLDQGRASEVAAKRLFGFSILYLFAIFAVLLGEHAVRRLLGS